jgi:hypothetical protein
MAWTTPTTVAAGEVLTAALWASDVQANSLAIRQAQVNVVSANTTTKSSTTSSSYADVGGMTVTITPSASTSKVLVILTIAAGFSSRSGALQFQLVRGATALGNSDDGMSVAIDADMETSDLNATFGLRYAVFSFLDSPATTSATTYKLQFRRNAGSGTMYFNRRGENELRDTSSTITAIEVPV